MLLVVSFVLTIGGLIPEALSALCGCACCCTASARPTTAPTLRAAIGLALTGGTGWLLRTVGSRFTAIFSDRIALAVETHVARLQASVSTIEHHERPDYLDRLQILHDHSFLLNHVYPSLMQYVGSAARLLITVGLLMSINPVLGLLVLFAIPTGHRVRRGAPESSGAAEERCGAQRAPGPPLLRTRHHAERRQGAAGVVAPSARSRRAVSGRSSTATHVVAAPALDHRRAQRRRVVPLRRARTSRRCPGSRTGPTPTRATSCSRSRRAPRCRASSARPSAKPSSCAGTSRRRSGCCGSSATWRRAAGSDEAEAPTTIARGITFDHVSFRYPGTDSRRARRRQPHAARRVGCRRSSARTARASRR